MVRFISPSLRPSDASLSFRGSFLGGSEGLLKLKVRLLRGSALPRKLKADALSAKDALLTPKAVPVRFNEPVISFKAASLSGSDALPKLKVPLLRGSGSTRKLKAGALGANDALRPPKAVLRHFNDPVISLNESRPVTSVRFHQSQRGGSSLSVTAVPCRRKLAPKRPGKVRVVHPDHLS